MGELLILVVSVLIASAICSMAEAAILSLPILRARILFEEGRKGARTLVVIKEDIHFTIASIVFVNNAINIIGAFFVGRKVTVLFGDQWLGAASALMTLGIIIGGEIIPKTLGERFKIPLSLFFAKPLRLLVWILSPFIKFIFYISGPLSKGYVPPKVTEEEIKMMLKIGRDAGTVEMDEEVLCNRVFRLNDLVAFQMMRPIDQVLALPGDKTLSEIKDTIIDSRFSRIVVYGKDFNDIVGVVEHRILLRHIARDHGQTFVKEFMSRPIFVNQAIKADALLQKFQAYNQHLFIVRDDEGKNIGLITMEDVLEELFGEIYDEKDVRVKPDHSKK